MTVKKYATLMVQVSQYFGKKIGRDRVKLWWPACRRIEDDALGYIWGKITEQLDDVPANLPKFMNLHYDSWREQRRPTGEDYHALPRAENARRARALIELLENKGLSLNMRSPAQ